MDAAVTLFAVESLETLPRELGADPSDPLLARRNVVLRGAELSPLLSQDFVLESAREQHNQFVDHGQHMVEDIVDSQQKEADEYFKRQLQVLEVRAEKLVKIFRD